jgi:hypothetical protein
MAQFPTFGNATGVWNINDVYNNVSGGTWPNFGAIGLFAGGGVGPAVTNITDQVTISTLGNATDFGDLTVTRFAASGGVSSLVRGIFGGGYISGSPGTNIIDYFTFSNAGNAADFGDLTVARDQPAGASNSTRGTFGGGYPTSNVIDYITMASIGNATDFGDLLVGVRGGAGAASATRGLFGGGYFASPISGIGNIIEFITFATTGNGTDFGDLTQSRRNPGATSSSTRALFGGGFTPTQVNTIDFVTISTAGNATDFGDLTQVQRDLAGTSNSVRGLFGGGSSGPANTNVINTVNIASTGNATDFGDLTTARAAPAAASNSHGGLSDGYQGTRPAVYFNSGDAAVFMGGFAQTPSFVAYDVIDTIKISSASNAIDFGDLSPSSFTNGAAAGTVSSAIRGLYAGGDNNSGVTNTIQYVTFSTSGNAADFGDATLPRYSLAGASNSTRGIMAGGFTTTPSSINTNVIDFVTIATIGNATDFGDLTVARREFGGGASPTRAVFMGSGNPAANTIDFVTIASAGNATDFGDLTSNTGENSVVTSSTRAVTVGKNGPSNVMEYITIASAGNAQNFGDLTVARRNVAGGSNSTRGVCAGGIDASANTNVIDFITIASVGNATDFGDLTLARRGLTGASNGHGGLQ